MELTDKQWEIIEPLIPDGKSGSGSKGRPRRNNREVLDAIMWILRTGAPWRDLPDRYPPSPTCHRRHQEWVKSKVLNRILESLAKDLKNRGGLDLTETLIDGSFTAAKKRGLCVGPTERGKGAKIMAIVDRAGLPISIGIESASPQKMTMVETTLDQRFVDDQPDRLIGDKAYDSDPLDERLLEQRGIEMIAPHKTNRKKKATQDGRSLQRYKRRWKVERLFAWLHNYRRLTVRWEFHAVNFLGFLKLGCIIILLKHF